MLTVRLSEGKLEVDFGDLLRLSEPKSVQLPLVERLSPLAVEATTSTAESSEEESDSCLSDRIRPYKRNGPPVFLNPLVANLAREFQEGSSQSWPPTDYVEALIVVLGNVRSSGGEYAVLARGPDGQFGLSLKLRSPRRIAVSKAGGTMFGREDEFLAYAAFENVIWMNENAPVLLMTKVRNNDKTFIPPYPNNDVPVTLEEFAQHMKTLGVNLVVHRSTNLSDFLLHWALKRLC